jgi:hypothetical protein
MNVFNATADFERWLAKRLPVVRQDIALKHQHMAEAAFPFFRATFYRWLQSDTPRRAGGLVSGAASKAVVPLVEASR